MFATGSHDGVIRIWSLPTTAREVATQRTLFGSTFYNSPTSDHVYSPKPRPQRLPSSSSFGFGPRSESPDHGVEQLGEEEGEDEPLGSFSSKPSPQPALSRKRRATMTG